MCTIDECPFLTEHLQVNVIILCVHVVSFTIFMCFSPELPASITDSPNMFAGFSSS